MAAREHLTRIFGEPVADAEEEAFIIFSQDIPSQSLGFIDSQAAVLDISVAGHDLTIHQSRGLLTSDRKAGTTGAVWKVTPLFAQWISSPTNFLFTQNLISPNSTAIELGAGVSGIVTLALGPKIHKYTATDQDYVLKLLRQNIAKNLPTIFPLPSKKSTKQKNRQAPPDPFPTERISVQSLDWETDAVTHLPAPNLVLACDCIYNESLIEPLNSTCAALCNLRAEGESIQPTLCIIAQQLRSPDVFEAWLKSFHRLFDVWQVPDALLDEGLREGSGFVVHVGVVR